jgi:hypothetical protein
VTGKDAHVDHIVRKKITGCDHVKGLQTLCASCHSRKTCQETAVHLTPPIGTRTAETTQTTKTSKTAKSRLNAEMRKSAEKPIILDPFRRHLRITLVFSSKQAENCDFVLEYPQV